MRRNEVKQAIARGEVRVGTWLHTLGVPATVQTLAAAGFDYVYVDMEHSAFSLETAVQLCATGLHAGIVPLVRPPSHEPHLIGRPLDNGALGVVVPHVDTAAQAEAAVRAAKFVPEGRRGSQPTSHHNDFAPVDQAGYMAEFNRQSLVVVQIESPEAVANIDEIMAVPGVDGATLGRGDYAIEIGRPGERQHPDVLDAVRRMVDGCRRHGKAPGLLVYDVEDALEWKARGVQLITYSSEVVMMREAGRAALARIRGA